MIMRKMILLTVGLLSLLLAGYAQSESKANNYQECVLEATREGFPDTKRDVGRIKEFCEQRFPDSAPNLIGDKLDDEALNNIDIYTNRNDNGDINGSVYNGNPHIIVTRLHILITPRTGKGSIEDFFDSEEYQLNLQIKPYSTEEFTIQPEKTDVKGLFRWKLIRAWGR